MDDPNDVFHLPTEAVGTPQFMAPELARGKTATPQSDIYSLGATLWFLLTGKPPFVAATTGELIKMHLNDPLPDLHAIRPDVPESLAKAIHTAMAKNPADRYADAEQIAKVLRVFTIPVGASGALSNTGVLSDFGSQQQEIQERRIRRMGWRMVGVGALVAACIAGAISAVFLMRGQKPATTPAVAQTPPPQAASPKPAATPVRSEAMPAAARVGDANSPRLFKATDRDALYDLGKREGPLNLDSRVAVEGVVESAQTSNTGKVFRIEFTGASREDGFHAVYFPKNDMFKKMQEKFGGEHGSGLTGKTIRVSGIVTLFDKSRPQIVIQSPDQVEIVK
jgi:hypothetical protein